MPHCVSDTFHTCALTIQCVLYYVLQIVHLHYTSTTAVCDTGNATTCTSVRTIHASDTNYRTCVVCAHCTHYAHYMCTCTHCSRLVLVYTTLCHCAGVCYSVLALCLCVPNYCVTTLQSSVTLRVCTSVTCVRVCVCSCTASMRVQLHYVCVVCLRD